MKRRLGAAVRGRQEESTPLPQEGRGLRHRVWSWRRLCALVLVLWSDVWLARVAAAQFPPLVQGEAVTTAFSGLKVPGTLSPIDPNGPVVTVLDIRDPAAQGAPLGLAWTTIPFFRHPLPPSWTAANLGQVFGITIDDAASPNIYVAASTAYLLHVAGSGFEAGMFGLLGPGGIYQLDGTTGNICTFAVLPNSGPALGNITYDAVHRQFFVSNLQDGLIYRIPNNTKACHSLLVPADTFDHGQALPTAVPSRPAILDPGVPFDPTKVGPIPAAPLFTPGFTPRGRRPWGLAVFDGRLYYAVWTIDTREFNTSTKARNEIWSVALTASGDFNPTDVRLEKILPLLPGFNFSNPVASLAFTAQGKMLAAERVRNRDYGVSVAEYLADPSQGLDAHRARLLEFTVGAPVNEVPKIFYVGNANVFGAPHANSSGGADYGYGYAGGEASCDGTVAAMGDALRLPGQNAINPSDPFRVYGLQLCPASGNSPNAPLSPTSVGVSSYFINLGPPGPAALEADFNLKTQIGAVAVNHLGCRCMSVVNESVLCAADGTNDYIYNFQVTNLSSTPAHDLLFVDLPAGVTVTPNDVQFAAEGGFLAPGQTSQVKTVRIHGASPGTLTFRFLLLDGSGNTCCAILHQLTLPKCDCAQVLTDGAVCSQAGGYDYTFKVQDLLAAPPVSYALVTATTPGLTITQSGAAISPALGFGGTSTQTVHLSGPAAVPGATLCFQIGVHDLSLADCCAITRCVTLPRGGCFFPGPGSDLDLSLSTGPATPTVGAPAASGGEQQAATGTAGAVDPADPAWTVVRPGSVRPAQTVLTPDADWPWALPGTSWISLRQDGASAAGAHTVRYRRCFCIGAGARTALLDAALWADHRATLLLDGRPIAGPGGDYDAATPLSVHLSGAVGEGGPFSAGTNCLVAVVEQSGTTTGFDLLGSVQAAGGACSQP